MPIALALAAAMNFAPAASPPTCRFTGEPRAWTTQALQAWDKLDRRRLRIARPVTPTITLFDAACAYTLTPDPRGDFARGGRRYRTAALPHQGEVPLPDGTKVPAQRLAFATPTSDGGMFFIMALPSLWRADTAEARDPRLLSMVVFMHEFTHTQLADGLGSRIDRLLTLGMPEDANDDVVQDRFADRAGYRQAWERERDTFFDAAQTSDQRASHAKLAEGLSQMRDRRARWFTGDNALYAEADDVFLTLEGTGNWSAWAWLTDPDGGRMTATDGVAFIRGDAAHWSQDEGLAVILAIDRLTPDWPSKAFGPGAMTADQLAERALQPSRSSE